MWTSLLMMAAPFAAHAGARKSGAASAAKHALSKQAESIFGLTPAWSGADCVPRVGSKPKIPPELETNVGHQFSATATSVSMSFGGWCEGRGLTDKPDLTVPSFDWSWRKLPREGEGISGTFGNDPQPGLPRDLRRPDFNRNIFYAGRLEFSWEAGYLRFNTPFLFEFLLGADYETPPLQYTLVPEIGLLRWQFDNVGGPSFLRGNWEATFGGSFTGIVRGPESRWGGYVMGIRRNFVQRNWRVVPFLDGNVGAGGTDAKEPAGFLFAQGQDFTFTLMLGGGVRYDFDSRYAFEVGLKYMHISNLYLSEPKYPNYGINVYGPMIGLDIRLGGPRRASEK